MNRGEQDLWRHDIRSSLNGVICMGSILADTELSEEQKDILKYMLSSAHKTLELFENGRLSGENRLTGSDEAPLENVPSEDGSHRILVAEDDEINRLYLTTILRRKNWIIDEAANGFQAVKFCQKHQYKMILMDVSMPGLDGFQAAKQIRTNGSTTPIIAITAHSLLDLKDKFTKAGVNEVLRKPFNEDHLLEIIEKLTRVSEPVEE